MLAQVSGPRSVRVTLRVAESEIEPFPIMEQEANLLYG